MKTWQVYQTMNDIFNLYESDIGSAKNALSNQLMVERTQAVTSPIFANMDRKSGVEDLDPNQLWYLHEVIFLNWMHYQTRCVVPLRRSVIVSDYILNSNIRAVSEITEALKEGKSLKSRVSRRVLKALKAKHLREDPLLWHWHIHHFHLGEFDPDLGYAKGIWMEEQPVIIACCH
jgi:hypothetical protein